MAWIQLMHRRNWHSIICAQVKDAAVNIRSIYTKLLENYPPEMWEEEMPPRFAAFGQSLNTRLLPSRGCRVTVSSGENTGAARGADFAMAHLSEVAFWRTSRLKSPREMVQALVGGVACIPGSVVVLESTANGVGSFFHQEWMRAVNTESSYEPVFIPWHEIDFCRREMSDADAEAFAASLAPHELDMWRSGLTLEQIAWYRLMHSEMGCKNRMMSEFPVTPVEAFANSGAAVFPLEAVERMRASCRNPDEDDVDGLAVWEPPESGDEYVVAVDVGGHSVSADFSVIAVMNASRARPEVCAQWRGHLDHDLLARKVADIAARYNNALLVVESNTPDNLAARTGEPSPLLDALADSYPNYYRRTVRRGNSPVMRPGFHMNRTSKAAIIATLRRMVNDCAYVERDTTALDEMITYEQLPNGSWQARHGCHDDVLMTRAMALHIIASRRAAAAAPVAFAQRA